MLAWSWWRTDVRRSEDRATQCAWFLLWPSVRQSRLLHCCPTAVVLLPPSLPCARSSCFSPVADPSCGVCWPSSAARWLRRATTVCFRCLLSQPALSQVASASAPAATQPLRVLSRPRQCSQSAAVRPCPRRHQLSQRLPALRLSPQRQRRRAKLRVGCGDVEKRGRGGQEKPTHVSTRIDRHTAQRSMCAGREEGMFREYIP